MLNRQLVLNDVFAALKAQGQRATNAHYSCRYRVPGTTLKCGIGHLIPDANYDAEFDELTLTATNQRVLAAIDPKYGTPPLGSEDAAFLRAIQSAHDNSHGDFVPQLTSRFIAIAAEYNLELNG